MTIPTIGRPIIIYGAPTVGKSFTEQYLARNGYSVMDTDILQDKVVSDLRKEGKIISERPWRNVGTPEYRAYNARMNDEGKLAMRESDADFIITNLWYMLSTAKIKPDIAVARVNPKRIHELSIQRGGTPIPMDVAKHWGSEDEISKIRRHNIDVQVLEDDEFLLDYVIRYLNDHNLPVGETGGN